MTIELLDLELFFMGGGLFAIILIAGILLAVKSVFIFLMWDRSNIKYLINFLAYVLGAVGVLFGGLISAGLLMVSSEVPEAYVAGMLLFIIPVLASVGLRTYLFIDTKWLSKEEKA